MSSNTTQPAAPPWTPGPWEIKSDPAHYDTLSSIRGGERIDGRAPNYRIMVEVGGYIDFAEQEANTRLIAAAPDMAEALKLVVNHWGCLEDNDLDAIEAALQLARAGREGAK